MISKLKYILIVLSVFALSFSLLTQFEVLASVTYKVLSRDDLADIPSQSCSSLSKDSTNTKVNCVFNLSSQVNQYYTLPRLGVQLVVIHPEIEVYEDCQLTPDAKSLNCSFSLPSNAPIVNNYPVDLVFEENIKESISTKAIFSLLKPFNDVSKDEPMAQNIYNLRDNGIINGFEDGTFKPEALVPRSHLAKFLTKGLAIKSDKSCNDFVDVAKANIFYSEIMALKCQGIVNGFDGSRFGPDLNTTRGEAIKFAIKGLLNKEVNLGPSLSKSDFVDVNSSNTFWQEIKYAEYLGLLPNYGTKLESNKYITRSEVAYLVDKARILLQACAFEANLTSQLPVNFLINPVSGTVSRGFSCSHDGVDILGELNTPIKATAEGKVVAKDYHSNGYGHFLILEHSLNNQKIYSLYAHLNEASKLNIGENIAQNQIVGLMGRSGLATAVHLHFSLISSSYQSTKNSGCRNGGQNPSTCYNPAKFIKF